MKDVPLHSQSTFAVHLHREELLVPVRVPSLERKS